MNIADLEYAIVWMALLSSIWISRKTLREETAMVVVGRLEGECRDLDPDER